jgi:hypothetical protein
MSTHQFMRSEYPAHGPSAAKAKAAVAPKRRHSPLEIALIAAGGAAWAWCLYEIALLLFR